ncbi:M20/M25/M40 family metallo-hydrolase [Runella limosa]|uniref:M20/M25/M40 family metallo-hydrolase n=1 Tax=Runella limosa TaxID=370978 RepID=UPI00040885F5|nr:M20/M25/M40 family metallo-hydrolase [Runella limosa]MCA0232608.1 M20/M25/M40 family metallo-hydrolase [Bacteroidota bacterium]
MYRHLFPSFLVSASFCVIVAFRDNSEFVSAFQKINNETLKNSQAYETLGDATSTIGHRLTGSPNGAKAEQYAFNLLKKYGYTDVKFQSFEVESWMRDTVTLDVVPNKSDNFRTVPVVALAHSPVRAKVSGAIVDVGNGLEEDFEAVKDIIKGKVALVNIGLVNGKAGQKNLHRSEKTALAIKYGANAIITVNQVVGNVLLTGTASVTGALIGIPAVNISRESGEEIRNWMKVDNDLHAIVDMTNVSKKIKARNVIATIPGKSDDRIVIGGHLDSWDLATGAADNGLGSFTIMDIARTFKALKIKPKRTIDFVLFMGEEQGLLGSRQMVKELAKAKQLEKVKFMMNLDMTNNVFGMSVGGRDELIPFFQAVGEQIKKVDDTYSNIVSSRAGLHSDHQPFMLEGIPTGAPAGRLGANVYGCYHADCDKFDLINRDEMVNGVRFSAMLLYALANANDLPAQKLDTYKTRDLMVAQGLKKELVLGKDWKWTD